MEISLNTLVATREQCCSQEINNTTVLQDTGVVALSVLDQYPQLRRNSSFEFWHFMNDNAMVGIFYFCSE